MQAETKRTKGARRRGRQKAQREALSEVFSILMRMGMVNAALGHPLITAETIYPEGMLRLQKLLGAALEKAARGVGPEAQKALLDTFPDVFKPAAPKE